MGWVLLKCTHLQFKKEIIFWQTNCTTTNKNAMTVVPLVCVLSWALSMVILNPGSTCNINGGGSGNGSHQFNLTTAACSIANSSGDSSRSSCWEGYTEQPYAYLLFVPLTGALAVSASWMYRGLHLSWCTSTTQYLWHSSLMNPLAPPSHAYTWTNSIYHNSENAVFK